MTKTEINHGHEYTIYELKEVFKRFAEELEMPNDAIKFDFDCVRAALDNLHRSVDSYVNRHGIKHE